MYITHNMPAINTLRQTRIVKAKSSKLMEKLSSGYKINRAGDDAAGLAISEEMRRQIWGLTQGVNNIEDGISLSQTAEGALSEVSAMLNRMTELAVQSANGTYSETSREAIQLEMDQLLDEIDRIGEHTEFNKIKLFDGDEEYFYNDDGTIIDASDLEFTDFRFIDVSLGESPFYDNNFDHVRLQAIVDGTDTAVDGKTYNMLFGNGSTSHSSMKLSYTWDDGTTVSETVLMKDLEYWNTEEVSDGMVRRFRYYLKDANGVVAQNNHITVTQKITIPSAKQTNTEKAYTIQTGFMLVSPFITNVSLDFMYHMDSAYNNNDYCEGYYINDGSTAKQVDKYGIYSNAGSSFTDGINNPNIDSNGVPGSFSIVDVDDALPFSEKIEFSSPSTDVDSLSIGRWNLVDDWSYYDPNTLNANLGQNAIRTDLGFSLMKHMEISGGNLTIGSMSFDYKIVETTTDQNLDGIQVTPDASPVTNHLEYRKIWIHAAPEKDVGMWISIHEMNTEALGIKELNVQDQMEANAAIDKIRNALNDVSENRGHIGSCQNRLEYMMKSQEVTIENITAAESRIRDTDMAELIVELTKQGILQQAGQAMLAQANATGQGVLNMLS